ncbi:hypothetical protein NM688_g7388 [Phlebia brevispora]|uniref:Uncharacterized protein n=1 Tax=Phlebia brevispora TaxID=194682 RepID=A0ACC1S5X6_9APHY|nr:hypothetical protein NM688_g7388 [Phlebia brevispora]
MFASRRSVFAVIAAGLSLVSAQSISSQCQGTLTSIVLSDQGTCLNAQALIGVLMAGSNSSLISPINSWLTGLCAEAACSNDTLASLSASLTSGCQTELGSLGFGNVTAGQLTSLVQTVYPTVRQIACLEDTTSNTLCVTEALNGLQAAEGTVTAASLETLLQQIVAASVPDLPDSVKCSDCSKETFLLVEQGFPGLMGSDTESNIDQTCGANFTDGQIPSDVRQTANGATSSSTNSSTNTSKSGDRPTRDISATGFALSSLFAALSAFALLG